MQMLNRSLYLPLILQWPLKRKNSFATWSLGENKTTFPGDVSLEYTLPRTVIPTSKEKRTPPIGLPKATATPAAAQALNISRVLAALRLYLSKNLEITLPVHTA